MLITKNADGSPFSPATEILRSMRIGMGMLGAYQAADKIEAALIDVPRFGELWRKLDSFQLQNISRDWARIIHKHVKLAPHEFTKSINSAAIEVASNLMRYSNFEEVSRANSVRALLESAIERAIFSGYVEQR